MQLKQALTAAVDRLEAADVGSPRLNAEVLLMFVLGVHRAYLYAHPERELTGEENSRYDEVLAQRSTGMPSQYITGHQEFWGLDFVVTPAVLIPRPETEHLVETVLELARGVPSPKIVDVGTGSGCIALSLAHELKGAEVYAVDLSADALEIARANAARLQLDGRVKFAQCDVLTPVQNEGVISSAAKRSRGTSIVAGITLGDFDFVVSNPPYVGFDEADKVQKSVRDFGTARSGLLRRTRTGRHRPADRTSSRCSNTRRLVGDGDWLFDARCGGESARCGEVGRCARRAGSAGDTAGGGGQEASTVSGLNHFVQSTHLSLAKLESE